MVSLRWSSSSKNLNRYPSYMTISLAVENRKLSRREFLRRSLARVDPAVRQALVPGFVESGLRFESLYEHLDKEYGLVPAVAADTVETREATGQEADLLQIRPRSLVIFVARISYLGNGSTLEFVTVASRGDRYQYKVVLSGWSP